MRRGRITGTGSYAPERVMTNADLEQLVATSDEWIRERTGIRERRIAAPEQACSDLGLIAAERALKAAGLSGSDLDLILLATCTGDMPLPSTACLLQHRLGATRAAACDISAACCGFVYALGVADAYVRTGMRHVLVVGSEVMSTITDWTDRNTCILFGDGAGAAVVSAADGDRGILSTHLHSDGSLSDLIVVPGGGTRIPPSEAMVGERSQYIKMKGNETFKVGGDDLVQRRLERRMRPEPQELRGASDRGDARDAPGNVRHADPRLPERPLGQEADDAGRGDPRAAREVHGPAGRTEREGGEDPVDGVAEVEEVDRGVGGEHDLVPVEERLELAVGEAAGERPGGEEREEADDDGRHARAPEPRFLDHPLDEDGIAARVERLLLDRSVAGSGGRAVEGPVGKVDEEGLSMGADRLDERFDPRSSRREEGGVDDRGGGVRAEEVVGRAGEREVGRDERRLREGAEGGDARFLRVASVAVEAHRVDDDDLGPFREELPRDGRADEAGAARDEDAERHAYSLGSGVGAGPRVAGAAASVFAFSASRRVWIPERCRFRTSQRRGFDSSIPTRMSSIAS